MSKRRISPRMTATWAIWAFVLACEGKQEVEVGMHDAKVPDVGVISGGTQNLCTALAQSYDGVVEAHRSCTADTDCKFYEKVGMCGTALNDKLPAEHLAHIGALQKAYACQLPTANCPNDRRDEARCVTGTCQAIAD